MASSAVDNARLRRVVASAAGDVVNLAVAGASVIAALAVGSWGLLLLGGTLYALLTGWRVASPSYWQRVLCHDTSQLLRLPEPSRVSDPAVRSTVAALHAGRAEVLRTLTSMPDDLLDHTRFTGKAIDALEQCASRLVQRADELNAYLRTVNRDALLAEVRRIDDLVRRCNDPEVREQYQKARAARQEQIAIVDELTRAHDRVTASLQRLLAIFEGLPARLVRLRVLDSDVNDDLVGELDDELARMNDEILTSEHSLRQVTSVRKGELELDLADVAVDGARASRVRLGLPEGGRDVTASPWPAC